METQAHLRPLDGDDSNSTPAPPGNRAAARRRPGKSLPTDRMKMDMQKSALLAIARQSAGSGPDARPVDAAALGASLGISPSTAPLSNGFFLDSGWIERRGKGIYVATDALMDYYREGGAGSGRAIAALRPPAMRSWYWQVLDPSLRNGPMPVREAVMMLMRAADAQPDHRPQIMNLIEWLSIIGLVTVDGDDLKLSVSAELLAPPATPATTPADAGTPGDHRTADPSVSQSTTREPGTTPGPLVLAFGFDAKLTVDDLARLSPEQITALFQAVGTVAAVSRAAKGE